jgi:sugar phosphate permease
MFAPLVNYGLGHIKDALSPWKYMYIFAGSITILWSLVILFFLPPEPIRARGFTERERYIAVARLRANNAGVRNTHIKPAQILEVVYDPRFWLVFLSAFSMMVANGPLSTYLPIIISGFGYSPLNSLLLSMPAGAVAGCFTLLSTWLAGRLSHRGWRTWLVAMFQMPIILASLLLWQLPPHNKAGRLAGIYLLAGFASPYGIVMSLQAANAAGYTKKSVTASGLFIGYCFGTSHYPQLVERRRTCVATSSPSRY